MNSHTDIVDSDRTCIMVLGMHRSGTSALTRVINLLGAALPGDLLEANEWNESGYWEPDKLVSLNEHMLREAGSSWNDWRPFTSTALDEDRLEHYRNEIRKQIIEDYGNATLFVLKDPRISRFTPLYIEVLTDLGITPHFVIMYRNPLGVIGSLSQRDQMTPGFASLMWLQHQLAAERATRGFPRTFLSYANLLDDWRGSVKRITTELGMVWPRSIESASSEIDSFISPDLQHHPQQPEDLTTHTTIPQWIKDSYTALQRLENSDPDDGDALRSLEKSYREFQSQAEVFGDALEENHSVVSRLTEERNQLVRNLTSTSARATDAEASVNTLRAEKEQLDHAVAHYEERVWHLEEENKRSTAREHELSDRVAELTNAESELTDAESELRSEKSKLTDDLAQLRSETERLTSRISELENQKLKLHEYGEQLVTQRRNLEAQALNLKTPAERQSPNPVDDIPKIEALPGMEDLSPTQRAEIRDAFDDDFYLKKYLDVAASGIDPFEHFLRHGWKEGRNPSPDFSTNYYRSWAPGLAADTNPFIHWIIQGRHSEEYTTLPGMGQLTQEQQSEVRDAFDADFYLRENTEIKEAGIDPFEHFMRHGWREGRNPRHHFSLNYYQSWAPDLEPDVNPFIHWITYGRHQPNIANLPGTDDLSEEQLTELREAFDADFYLESNPDIGNIDPFEHFMRHGWREGRNPRPHFSLSYYRSWAPDLEPDVNPFIHWIVEGRHNEKHATLPGMGHLTQEQKTELRDAFDADFYLDSNPDVGNVDPFEHFMRHGWREGRNPSRDFSTSYYAEWAPDLSPDINPLIHWITHGRRENRTILPFRDRLDRIEYNPKVSVVVPNFNHERFLEQRLDSILAQTYENLEVLILDDCSTDESRALIEKYCKEFPDRVRSLFNEENSGNVFLQWRKGIEHCDGELVWICESDDFCEPDFLEHLVPHFRDRSVNLAFGRIQFSNEAGDLQRGLDGYREGAESGIWWEQLTRPARQWFTNGFGVNNVIANVGGCIWRRHDLPPEVWEAAEGYTVVGDWFLYANIAGGGQIAWEPKAVAYFRQHHANTSVNAFTTPPYYKEHERFMLSLRQQWRVPDETVERFYEKVSGQYEHFEVEKEHGPLESHLSKSKLLTPAPTQPHILLAFLGFHPGGGENFPIHLANELHRRGNLVSMMALDMSEVNTQMLETLDSGVPVYDSGWVAEYGADRFLADAGISIIHSHMVSMEWFFFEKTRIETEVPYLVSLHGSYQVSALADDLMERIVGSVSHWVYTAEKNLVPFKDLDLPPNRFTMLPNAMPNDPSPYPQTRGDLGIDDDAIVFTLVARGIKRKGWRAAINAFKQLRDSHPEQPMHLLLCGEGTETDRHLAVHDSDPDITFLGYQSHIHGLYRMSDVALVPTRFGGESYPLCIIQALQARTPVISTDAGEIRTMVTPPDAQPGGILVDVVRDTDEFTNRIRDAMSEMLKDDYRLAFVAAAEKLGTRYDMGKVAQDYEKVYEGLIEQT